MGKVTVYRFHRWNTGKDGYDEPSQRMGTREGIARINHTPIEDTGVEIDEGLLSLDYPGLTDKDFQP